jgi:ribose/xylose/arabinose/galactoside ABC-type transport system permease subunit
MSDHLPSLRSAAAAFLVGFLVHNADHVRRGLYASPQGVIWSGTVVAILAAAMLTLIFTHHPVAPFIATVGGFSIALGVAASHLLPKWGPLSDSLPDGRVDAFTWIAVLGEVTTGLLLGIVGLSILRRSNFHTQATVAWR